MSQGTPRKFSEKIAIMERKQNEVMKGQTRTTFQDEDAFSRVMREVRAITSNDTPNPNQQMNPMQGPPVQGLAPGQWNRPGGSLPNMVASPPWGGWQPPPSMPPGRGRSPPSGHMYHPYYKHPKNPHDQRVPPLDYHIPYPNHPQHLQPPDAWNSFGRARSDPAIHTHMMPMQGYMSGAGPMMGMDDSPLGTPMQPPQQGHPQPSLGQPPPMPMMPMEFGYPDRDMPVVGSLPNISAPGPSTCHHTPVGQRHSAGFCQTLATPSYAMESQSAPTSPSQTGETPAPPQWPPRNISNSPDVLDIPNIVLTGADGQLDCFQDLQDLHLDANEIRSLLSNGGQVDPMCETQLLP